jgi:hypothetical protein
LCVVCCVLVVQRILSAYGYEFGVFVCYNMLLCDVIVVSCSM